MIRYFFIFFFSLTCIISTSYAATFYRHVPFTASMRANDVLIMDYDFSGKSGIYCKTSHPALVRVSFSYKGHQKSASLPVILQSNHVPDKTREELTDTQGQFTLSIAKNSPSKVDVSCSYLGDEQPK